MSTTEYDSETGTRRLFVEQTDSSLYGDDARGAPWTSRYVSDHSDAGQVCDVGVYVVVDSDGRFGVDEQVIVGGWMHDEYGDDPQPDDSADISYDAMSYRSYETEEEAQVECDRLGQIDYSYAIYLRPQVQA